MSKPVRLRKLSIIALIDMLKKIYDEGADFIDIEGEKTDGTEDMIKISVKPEYYTNEEEGNNTDPQYMVTEQDYEEDEFPPINDEDINDLIK